MNIKSTIFASISLLIVIFSSCQKEEEKITLDGEWYIRAILEESTKHNELVAQYYKLYKRSDIANKYYKTFSFTDKSVIITTYDRDKISNKNTVITEEYPYEKNGNSIVLKFPNGDRQVYNYKFMGLGSKSVQLDFTNQFLNNNNETITTTNKTILIKNFPKDESEEVEVHVRDFPGNVKDENDSIPPPIGW